MKKTFTPAEIRHLLGISRSAIRYYKDKGLISVKKNEDNGYSYYGGGDLLELIDVSFYRNCLDSNADEIRELIFSSSPKEVHQHYQHCIADFKERIQRQQENLNLMIAFEERVEKAMEIMDQITEITWNEPICFYYPNVNGFQEDCDVDIHSPLFSVSYWSGEFSVENGNPVYQETSLMIDECYRSYLNEKFADVRMRILPAGRFLYTSFCSEKPLDDPAPMERLYAYAEEYGYTLSGEPGFVSYLFTFRDKGRRCHCYDAFLPVKTLYR